ncbi:hypothetical protein ACTU45_27330 [Streptomyces sp. 24-1644]|uniref:hypothetical protein n=1 Tax=Streptomyces sp. 24-1644 TaxID=3457315 RepID=UPI003FA748B4
MQLIDVSDYAVRSAVIMMRRKDTPLKFMLFPMVHVASPAFYAQVKDRLAECDLIVLEGITGTSRRASMLLLAYRFAPLRRRNGLVEQTAANVLPPGVPVLSPDVSAVEAMDELRNLPRRLYWPLLCLAPVMGLVFALRGPRAFLDPDLTVEDLPSTARAEMLADDELEHALLHRRNERLLTALAGIHTERWQEPITVAVVYGAGHMPAVVRGLLDTYGYRPRDGEWFTVCLPDP